MENRQSSPSPRRPSPRHSMQRQRSNSFPIVEALGCSTPEALLLLAEGRAAVRKRRARRNQSVDDEVARLFNPQDHLKFLQGLAALPTPQEQPSPFAQEQSSPFAHHHSSPFAHHHSSPFDPKPSHSRMPSDATDNSTCTVVPHVNHGEPRNPSPTLGDYSANLAAFIKSQLKSIPTYQSSHRPTSPLSPRSCPDLSFPTRTPSSPNPAARRQVEGPKAIDIPPVRPPMKSQFSAWSSTDDDTDDEALPLPKYTFPNAGPTSKGSTYTPSILGYYCEPSHNNSSFLFPSTPLEKEPDFTTAKAFKFPDPSASPRSSPAEQDEHDDDDNCPSSSCPSQPQLTSTSTPSYTSSSLSSSSYFDCKRPMAITPQMKERIIAAVTPPCLRNKRLTAVSAVSHWDGNAFSGVHDVYVESLHRVNVDGLSFDMLRDLNVTSRLTPC